MYLQKMSLLRLENRARLLRDQICKPTGYSKRLESSNPSNTKQSVNKFLQIAIQTRGRNILMHRRLEPHTHTHTQHNGQCLEAVF